MKLREAAYTPQNGPRLRFIYEDVSLAVTLRGTPFEFPDANGTYVQRTGNSGRRYPLRCIFSGSDHVEQANDFEGWLLAPGIGKLEHPVYGALNVVPFGDIARSEPLIVEGNQSFIEVTFYDTIDAVYAKGGQDPGSAVLDSVRQYNLAARNNLVTLGGLVNSAEFKAKYGKLLDDTKSGLTKVSEYSEDVQTRFDAIYSSINGGIDLLVADPLTLASQTLSFIESAARAPARIADRLAAYGNLAQSIIGRGVALTPFDFYTSDTFASTHTAAQVVSVLNHTFTTRREAIEAADTLSASLAANTAWRDANYVALGEVDTGEQYQALQDSVATAAGYLVQISFTLLQERRVRLTKARSPVDLCAELYGVVDAKLQFLIDSNDLSWQEHLEIPAGREVVYYV